MDKREIERIRKFWNKPDPPTLCSACKREVELPRLGTMAGITGDFPSIVCPHCGSCAGWTSTFTTGGRDAKSDINYLLEQLRALVPSSQPHTPTEERGFIIPPTMHYRVPHSFKAACGRKPLPDGLKWTTDTAYVTCPDCAAAALPVVQDEKPKADVLAPIKAVLTEITIWRGVNWNHAAADVCGEIERKLIAALRKVRRALGASRPSPADRQEDK